MPSTNDDALNVAKTTHTHLLGVTVTATRHDDPHAFRDSIISIGYGRLTKPVGPKSVPADPFARRLPTPLPIKDGRTLRTVADARAHILKLPAYRSERSCWQHVMKLMLDGASPEAIDRAVELALLYDGQIDFKRMK
jgi:hypothetical protein